LRKIGEGSYGDVWLARNTVGTMRAVKVVWRKTFWHDHPFEREFKGIQRFEPISRSHEGLVDILQIGRGDGYFYYVMELADGTGMTNDERRNPKEARNPNDETASHQHEPVRASGFGFPSSFDIRHSDFYAPRTLCFETQTRGRLLVSECVEIGLSLTSALTHLHNNGLVHRDVKPSNIIFVGGVPKLADIGLVTEASEARSYVGTEGFIPPEGPGTAQADLYSLGKLLYEISTGKDRHAFPELPNDLAGQSEAQQLVELNAILLKACQPEPRARYQTAAQMHADLQLLQQGQSVRRLRIVERRVAVLTRTTLITALLLAVASAAYLLAQFQARREATQRRVAEQLLYAADVNLAQQALEAGNLVRATTLLEAHRPGLKPEIRNPKSEMEHDLRGFEWYYLKNLCRGDEAHSLLGHEQAVNGVAISRDGMLLASCGDDHTIQLWDLGSRIPLATLRGHATAVNTVAVSPDGTLLASGGADKVVKIWDVTDRRLVAELTNHTAAVTSVAWSPDGNLLAVGTAGASARLWDIKNDQKIHEFVMTDRAAELVAVSPDGKWLAIGGNGPVLRFWDLATLQPGPEFYSEGGFVLGIAFSPDSKIVAATRSDGIVLWDITMRNLAGKLRGHDREVGPVAFSPDAKWVASGSEDTTVRVWDSGSHQVVRVLKGHKDGVSSLAFSRDGQMLISSSWDGTVKLWNLSKPEEAGVLRGHTDAVYCVAFTPDDRILASAGYDGTVKLWDVNSGTNLATLTGHTARVVGVAFSIDGETLFSCSLDQTIRLWSVATREPLATCSAGKRLSCLAVSPDGRTLACGTGWWDNPDVPGEVLFWDLASRQRLANDVQVHTTIQTLGFAPDGKTLAIGMIDGSLELLERASNQSILVSTNLGAEVAWSPRGNSLFAPDMSSDHVAVLDVAAHRISGHLQMSGGGAHCMAVSPDGRTLAIFCASARIKLCDVASGREVATLHGHEAFGFGLTFSHNGQILASGSMDRTVRLWRAPRNAATSVGINAAASR
jgi:WD40 repeat protein